VPVDQPVEATPVEPVVEAADSVLSSVVQRPEPMDRVIETPAAPNVVTVAPKTGERWAAVKKYEEAAVGALAEALRVIDDRVAGNRETRLSEAAPSSLDQANAIAEITTMSAQSQISGDEAKAKRDRLMSLGDVSVRLRTLVELFDTDFLTSEELEAKRSKLVKQLSGVLLP
jgi:hypothetical protein